MTSPDESRFAKPVVVLSENDTKDEQTKSNAEESAPMKGGGGIRRKANRAKEKRQKTTGRG